LGETGPNGKMSVKEADFSYKKVKGDQPESKPGMTKDKKKVIKKMQKMNKYDSTPFASIVQCKLIP